MLKCIRLPRMNKTFRLDLMHPGYRVRIRYDVDMTCLILSFPLFLLKDPHSSPVDGGHACVCWLLTANKSPKKEKKMPVGTIRGSQMRPQTHRKIRLWAELRKYFSENRCAPSSRCVRSFHIPSLASVLLADDASRAYCMLTPTLAS